jgi:site-specific DNA-methyltransferase (adenine-specific)
MLLRPLNEFGSEDPKDLRGFLFKEKFMLEIKEEFKKLIPPLTAEEFKQLEQNCLDEGIREKIITWDGFIIDGHNRFEIATRWNLEYQTENKHFENENDVKIWMIDNQNGRRNLTDGWKYKLQQNRKEILLEKHEQDRKNNRVSNVDTQEKNSESGKTRKQIAKALDWSTGKVAMADIVFKKATPELEEKVLNNEVTINQAYQEIKKEEKKINFEQKKAEFEKPIEIINTNQIIILGDSKEILPTLELKTFDLLLSDPPYGMDFKSGWNDKEKIANDKIEDTITLFENVLKECVPLLKDDAHFYLFGNIDFLSEIKPIIEKYLNLKNILIWDRKVIGMGDLKTYGFSYDIVYFGYNKKWKDLNGTRDRDILQFNRVTPSANIHPTEKPIDLLEYLIKKSTKENDNILDPFAGGGSTLLSCKNTNRLATGIEIEEKYYNLIKSRI